MDQTKLPKGKCAVCGKEIPVLSIRDKKPQYCGRVCGSMSRYGTRYRGTMSGPADKPDYKKKMSEL